MIDPLSIFIGLVFGALCGVMVTCLLVISKENKQREESRYADRG